MPKPIQVATAAIAVRTFAEAEGQWMLLLQQRSASREFPLHWECPGGKLEEHESPAEAVRRELMEELDIDVGEVCPRPIVVCAFNRPVGRVAYDVGLYLVVLDAVCLEQIHVRDAVGVGLFPLDAIYTMVCVPSCYTLAAQINRMGGLARVAETYLKESL